MVTTIRALKLHTGKYRVVPGRPLPPEMLAENPDDIHVGAANLRKQVENVAKHGVSPVICINRFSSDHHSEIDAVFAIAKELGVRCALSDHWAAGRRRRDRPGAHGNGSRRRAGKLQLPL